MVLRFGGWPITASVAVCIAATGALVAAAQDVDRELVTGSTTYVWGGPVPAPPKPGEHAVYVPSVGLNGDAPVPQLGDVVPAPFVAGIEPPKPHAPVIAAPGEEIAEGEGRESVGEADEPPVPAARPNTELARNLPDVPPPPLADPVEIGRPDPAVAYAPPEDLRNELGAPKRTPQTKKRAAKALPSYASLEPRSPRRSDAAPLPNRGALEDETPTGYQPMPKTEMQCRRALAKLGVRFTDATSISRGRSCGIDYPVKITEISPGVAMKPAATLNCMAALRVSQWVSNEVKPAAKSKLWKKPTALINASSYRCSRIAGSRTVSEHASGNALDVAGFQLADGSNFDVRKKRAFQFGEKGFQQKVRQSACRYFGTVLGPGYNRDHADHLHLDLKQRRRGVCR